jgi:alpha-galactosidase
MSFHNKMTILAVIMLSSILAAPSHGQGQTDIQIRGQEVRYTSGETVYLEALAGDRWVGRYWNAEGRIEGPREPWDDDAFVIRIKDTPSPPTTPGTLLSKGWQWVSASELPKTERGARHAVVELSNILLPIKLKIHTLLDGTPILTRWLEITNNAPKPVALTELFPWSGRLWAEEAPITLGHSATWDCFSEAWFDWTRLKPGTSVFKNDKGLVWDDPYFVLRNEASGEYFFGQLAWSVNYEMEFQREKGLTFKVGPTAVNALRVMAPGETITTPAVHLGPVKQDFDAAVQAMHEHIRRSVLLMRKPDRAYRIQYLFPEDQGFTVVRGDDYNEANVMKCMDVAAAAGLEVFIVDGPSWAEGTLPNSFGSEPLEGVQGLFGNWVPRKKWFPRGFDPLVDHAHKNGLLFGLYAEPEGGRGDWTQTEAFKKHPEWFVPRRPMLPGPNFLNISYSGAAAYMESELNHIIEDYKLDLYRHDQNGTEGGEGSETLRYGFLENDYWRHYEALWAIFERIHQKYPDLILQQASAGGARSDLATVPRWQEHMSSDVSWYPTIYQMASGFSVWLPPEIIVMPHGMDGPNHPDLETMLRGAYTLGNTPMIFNSMLPKSLEEFPPSLREKFLHYANLYKKFIRPMLATTRVYHHAPVNATGGVETGNWFAMEFTSPDRTKGWATIIRLSKTETGGYLFRPNGLDSGKRYRVTFDNIGETKSFDGAMLMRDGVAIRPTPPVASELLLFEAL